MRATKQQPARPPKTTKTTAKAAESPLPETLLADEDEVDAAGGTERDEEIERSEVTARPLSEVTGRHDEGSGANETIDGLDELQEAARHGAEDVPSSERREKVDDVPVFDRADTERKI